MYREAHLGLSTFAMFKVLPSVNISSRSGLSSFSGDPTPPPHGLAMSL